MKRLIFALLLVPIICFGQSNGNVRMSYWNGSLWSTGTWTGTGTTPGTGTSDGTLMVGDDIRVITPEFQKTIFRGGDGVHWYRIPGTWTYTGGTYAGRTLFACEDRISPADYGGETSIATRYTDDRGKTLSPVTTAVAFDDPWMWMNPTFVGVPGANRVYMLVTRVNKNDNLTNLNNGTSTDLMRQYICYTDDGGDTFSTPTEIASLTDANFPIQKVGTGMGTYSTASGRVMVGRWRQPLNTSAADRVCGVLYTTDFSTWTYSEAGSGYECQVSIPTSNYIRLNARQAVSGIFNRKIYTSIDDTANWDAGVDDEELPDPNNSASEIWFSGTNGRLVFCNTVNTQQRSNFGFRNSKDRGVTWTLANIFDGAVGNGYTQLTQLTDKLVGIAYEGPGPGYSITWTIVDATTEAVTEPSGVPVIVDGDGSSLTAIPLQNLDGPIAMELWSGTNSSNGKLIITQSGTPSGVTINNTGSIPITFQTGGTSTLVIAGDGKLTNALATGTTGSSIPNKTTNDTLYVGSASPNITGTATFQNIIATDAATGAAIQGRSANFGGAFYRSNQSNVVGYSLLWGFSNTAAPTTFSTVGQFGQTLAAGAATWSHLRFASGVSIFYIGFNSDFGHEFTSTSYTSPGQIITQGNLTIGTSGTAIFEGATPDAFETFLTVVDPTADRTITLPNTSGTAAVIVASGTVVLVSGTQSTVNAAITANSTVIPTLRVVGGTVAGSPVVQVFAGTALFTGGASDTSTYNFMVINP